MAPIPSPLVFLFSFFVSLLLGSVAPATAQSDTLYIPLPIGAANKLLAESEQKNEARYSVAIREVTLPRDSTHGYYPERLLTPASVTKLFTAASALTSQGAGYSFETKLYYVGTLQADTLYGFLLVKGSGDPSIDSKYFPRDRNRWTQHVVQALKSKGIRHITEGLVVDASRWEFMGFNRHWATEDFGNYYAAGVYGFNTYDNWLDLYFSTHTSKQSIRYIGSYPQEHGFTIHNNLDVRCNGNAGWRGHGKNLEQQRTLSGILPCRRNRIEVSVDLPHPPLFAARDLKRIIQAAGISIEGEAQATFSSVQQEGRLMGIYYSPTLARLCREMNVRSLNHYAEALLKMQEKALGATTQQALQRERQLLQQLGVKFTNGAVLYDGSGLARANQLAAQDLTDLLCVMQTKADINESDAFVASLPRVGREGTVKNFMAQTPLRFYAKSGSMRGVQTYAGYVIYQGRVYAVALLANQVRSKARVRSVMQQYLEQLFLPSLPL